MRRRRRDDDDVQMTIHGASEEQAEVSQREKRDAAVERSEDGRCANGEHHITT